MTVRRRLAHTAPPERAARYDLSRLPVVASSTISCRDAATLAPATPTGATPTLITLPQARTDTMAEPAGTCRSVSVQRGRPVATSYALTVAPNPTTATPPPAAAYA